MILLSTGPGSKYLRHFEAAFLCHEDANNRVVKPRTHSGDAVSADMLYFGDAIAHANLLYAFWAPVMYLVYPEIRSSKFNEHAHPGRPAHTMGRRVKPSPIGIAPCGMGTELLLLLVATRGAFASMSAKSSL